MPQEILRPEILEQVQALQGADIVVGVPSFNNVATIGRVIQAIEFGLQKYFSRQRAVIVNADGGSTDGSQQVVLDAKADDSHVLQLTEPPSPVHKLVTAYMGIPGKGSAFRSVFRVAELLQARACAVVDSDLRSITPEWIDLLLSPVLLRGYDYVAPYYLRHKYDGTITNSIIYPLTRALYGKRLRQPIGGDFGFSGRLASHFLQQEVWESDVARYGIDIWMTITALCGDFRVCQSFLGAKIHDPKDPGSDLSAMLTQVVGSVFRLMETSVPIWTAVRDSEEVPVFGFRFDVGLEPVPVNVDRMIRHFRQAVENLREIWDVALAPDTARRLHELISLPAVRFCFPDELWVRVIYDFAAAHRKQDINRDHLLRSLTPLYMGRVASFVLETEQSSAREVESRIEQLCLLYEQSKPYLIERWNGLGPGSADGAERTSAPGAEEAAGRVA